MFSAALHTTLAHEGYYAFVKGDRGGETYRGIARNFHPHWPGWVIVDAVKRSKGGSLPWNYRIVNAHLDNLITHFYYQRFWQSIYLDQVKDLSLQKFIFDFYVNSQKNAIRVIQTVLRYRFNKPISVDGKMGSNTIAAINSCNPESLFNELKKARGIYYIKISKKGENAKFLKGWMKRLASFEYSKVANTGGAVFGLVLLSGLGFLVYRKLKIHNYKY